MHFFLTGDPGTAEVAIEITNEIVHIAVGSNKCCLIVGHFGKQHVICDTFEVIYDPLPDFHIIPHGNPMHIHHNEPLEMCLRENGTCNPVRKEVYADFGDGVVHYVYLNKRDDCFSHIFDRSGNFSLSLLMRGRGDQSMRFATTINFLPKLYDLECIAPLNLSTVREGIKLTLIVSAERGTFDIASAGFSESKNETSPINGKCHFCASLLI